MEPLIDEGEAFVRHQESLPAVDPHALLEGYFDFHYSHRAEIILVLTEFATLAELGLMGTVLTWRDRLTVLLVGPDAPLAKSVRAAMVLGGLQDCTMQFADAPADELRQATIAAAWAALGGRPTPSGS